MEEEEEQQVGYGGGGVSKAAAMGACAGMAVMFVAILHSPALLRLPPPLSLTHFMIRRFLCVFISSLLSFLLCFLLLLPIMGFQEWSSVFGVFGIRADHLWQAVFIPLSLTSLMYAGSFVSKFLFLIGAWKHNERHGQACLFKNIQLYPHLLLSRIHLLSSDVLAWRIYVVAPFTEELVFRACMIPLLLCGGFKIYTIICLGPVFFSLAHLSHFLELYYQQKYSFVRAALALGPQLGYTVIFGCYASFLFIRTGHFLAPVVAHVLCNIMGLPVLFSPQGKGLTTISFLGGILCFLWLLFPATNAVLYNDGLDDCRCWHGFCNWK